MNSRADYEGRGQIQRILVRGVNWLGDAIMSLPALERLRQAYPASSLTLLTRESLADLWRHHPVVDSVITVAGREHPWRVARRLRPFRFDLALLFPNSPRSALEVWLARIPRRVGYDRAWRNWLLTHVVDERPGRVPMRKLRRRQIHRLLRYTALPEWSVTPRAHHVHDYLHLVGYLGGNPDPVPPRLMVTHEEEQLARELLGGWDVFEVPWLGLNPGAEYGPAKRWPAARFAEAAIEVHRRTNCGWVIFGGRGDVDLSLQVFGLLQGAKIPHVVNLANRTTLRQLCAALRLCRVLLTNDTGPMHVAAAVGTPVVVPFGSTSPELTGPGLPGGDRHALLRSHVPCAPCFRRECPVDYRCLYTISVGDVVEATLRAASLPPVGGA